MVGEDILTLPSGGLPPAHCQLSYWPQYLMWHPQPGLRMCDLRVHAVHVGPLVCKAHESLIPPVADTIAARHVADKQCWLPPCGDVITTHAKRIEQCSPSDFAIQMH